MNEIGAGDAVPPAVVETNGICELDVAFKSWRRDSARLTEGDDDGDGDVEFTRPILVGDDGALDFEGDFFEALTGDGDAVGVAEMTAVETIAVVDVDVIPLGKPAAVPESVVTAAVETSLMAAAA
jgi:hypothetical protein